MFSPNPKNDPLLAAIKGVIAENDKHRDAVDLVNHYFQITDKRQDVVRVKSHCRKNHQVNSNERRDP